MKLKIKDDETFVDIVGYEGLYKIGNNGTIERAKKVLYEITDSYMSIGDDSYFIVFEMPEK